jgi:hypothetical protein
MEEKANVVAPSQQTDRDAILLKKQDKAILERAPSLRPGNPELGRQLVQRKLSTAVEVRPQVRLP